MANQLPLSGVSTGVRSGVSIIIPAFDDRLALRRLLTELRGLLAELGGSIERSSAHKPDQPLSWELIVVEGSRPSGSAEEPLESDRALTDQWLQCEANRARQLQLGAENARFSHLWFLHADTSAVAAPMRWLSRLLGQATLGDAAELWGRFDVRLDSPRPSLRVVSSMMNWRSRLSGICTGDQGLFVSRELLAGIGGWPDQPLMEDVELSRRLKSVSRPKTPRATLMTSARRWHKNGVLRTILLMWRLRWQYFFGVSPDKLQILYNPTVARSMELDGASAQQSNGATRAS